MFNLFTHKEAEPQSELSPPEGTNLARLLDMRLENADDCGCDRCTDLITKIHLNGTQLIREHTNEQWGLQFWTKNLPEKYVDEHYGFHPQGDILERTAENLMHHEKLIDSLIEAEHQWRDSVSGNCNSQDNDEHWINHYKEAKSQCARARAILEYD